MGSRFDDSAYAEAIGFGASRRPRAAEAVPERVVQQLWYDRARQSGALTTLEGHRLEVISPGWWNFCAGPDFQGAQLSFNGKTFTGDVEVHLDQAAWRQHGHDTDKRYNGVLLHVLLNPPPDGGVALTASGRPLPHLVLRNVPGLSLPEGPLVDAEERPGSAPRHHGSCNRFLAEGHPEVLTGFLPLAGDWRMLNKTRRMQEQIALHGVDQAAYEAVLGALGYKNYTAQFQRMARALPFERAAQLARQEPFLLEATLLHLAGLLGEGGGPHGERLRGLREEHLPTLNALALEWPLAGGRPNNYPGRRIAAAAALVSRLARDGFARGLDRLWSEPLTPLALRKQFEALFPPPMGFWSRHYRLDGPTQEKSSALVGTGRVRSIIGNIFVPLALAMAREAGDQTREERIFAFYRKLPAEPENQIYTRMAPRILGDYPLRLDFRTQQGLMQMHEDWCRNNPSCRDCALLAFLDQRGSISGKTTF